MIATPLILTLMGMTPEAPFNPRDRTNPEYVDPAYRYENCVALIEDNADAARALAEDWARSGGGAPPRHCMALADLARGRPRLAAIGLIELSERTDAGDMLVRARLLEQAALAWLEAEEPAFAAKAIAQAHDIAPNAGEIRLTAGIIYAANEQWQRTIDAISAAEEVGIVSTAGYIARSRGYTALSKHRQAAEDVVAALKRDPENLDALVLRGELQQLGISIDASYRRPQ